MSATAARTAVLEHGATEKDIDRVAPAFRPLALAGRTRPPLWAELGGQWAGVAPGGAEGHVPGGAQFKLAVSQPGDPSEQEADRVAEQVMSAPESVQRACDCGGTCGGCGPETDEQAGLVQPSRAPGQGGGGFVAGVPSSGGQSLDPGARQLMEHRFGQDFGHVRVHDDAAAAESTRALNARAYTVGTDVYFGAGEYRPEGDAGRRLIAHELTHVLQQRGRTGPARVQRWALGAAPVNLTGAVVVTDPLHIARVGEAETIVRSVLTSRNCRNFFSSRCTNGAGATALQQAFDNATIYHLPVDDNAFGLSRIGTPNIAYNIRAFRIGRFMMASTLLHEMFHTCDPARDARDELDAETAVESCRLHTPWIDRVRPGSGAAGTQVTITGVNFGPSEDPTDTVSIGGVAASVVSWTFSTDEGSSLVTIVAEVPAGAGAGGVVVTNNGVASNNGSFTVI